MLKLKNWTVSKVWWTNYWIVDESFIWYLDYEDKKWWCIIAEKWFKTDYWSVPRILWSIFDKTKYNMYCLHDKMYSTQMKYHIWNKEFELLTRYEADMILLEWIAYEWAGFIERLCIYLWVRIGGFYSWYFKN